MPHFRKHFTQGELSWYQPPTAQDSPGKSVELNAISLCSVNIINRSKQTTKKDIVKVRVFSRSSERFILNNLHYLVLENAFSQRAMFSHLKICGKCRHTLYMEF